MKEINDIKIVHSILLNIAKEIHRVCDKYNVPYYITGGTMLGAIRHKGFIPWDDDIDIVIPREKISYFVESFKKEQNNKYSILTVEDEYDINYDSLKVVDNDTIIIETARSKDAKPIGLFVDIFPLDYCRKNQSFFSSTYWVKRLLYINSLAYKHRIKKGRVSLQLKSYCAHLFPKGFFKKVALILIPSRSEYCVNYGGTYGSKEVVQTSIFGKPTLYQFEDTFFWGLQDADTYLKQIYGDYLELPPVEKRIVHLEGLYIKD